MGLAVCVKAIQRASESQETARITKQEGQDAQQLRGIFPPYPDVPLDDYEAQAAPRKGRREPPKGWWHLGYGGHKPTGGGDLEPTASEAPCHAVLLGPWLLTALQRREARGEPPRCIRNELFWASHGHRMPYIGPEWAIHATYMAYMALDNMISRPQGYYQKPDEQVVQKVQGDLEELRVTVRGNDPNWVRVGSVVGLLTTASVLAPFLLSELLTEATCHSYPLVIHSC